MSFIRVVLPSQEFITARVTRWKENDAREGIVKCTECGEDTMVNPKMDVIQHGMFEQKVFTVFQCDKCNRHFALEYRLSVEERKEF